MRIIYIYQYDVTGFIQRRDVISVVTDYIKKHHLTFLDICFSLEESKYKEMQKKKYFEKLLEADDFWQKYFGEYEFEQSKSVRILSLSNLQPESWKRRELNEDFGILLNKINEQMDKMPKGDNFKISFDGINWNEKAVNNEKKLPLQDEWTPKAYPLSSNITICSSYNDKIHIGLVFEMDDQVKAVYEKYVDDFEKLVSTKPEKTVLFVKNEAEKQSSYLNDKRADEVLNEMEHKIIREGTNKERKATLHIKKILNEKLEKEGFEFISLKNCLYEFHKIDKYNNLMELFFDYDRRSLSAALSYKGAGYKKGISFNEIADIINDEEIEQYVDAIILKCKEFEEKCVKKLVHIYGETPRWLEW